MSPDTALTLIVALLAVIAVAAVATATAAITITNRASDGVDRLRDIAGWLGGIHARLSSDQRTRQQLDAMRAHCRTAADALAEAEDM